MLSEAAMCRYCFSVKVSMPETVGKPLAVHTLRRCWSVTAHDFGETARPGVSGKTVPE